MNRYGMVVAASALALVACKQDTTATPSGTAQAVASTPPPPRMSATPPSAAPTGPFEGEIVMTVKDESAMKIPQSMTFDVKGDKVRYSSATSGVRAVADMAGQRAYAISDARKTYATVDVRASTPPAPLAAVTKTPWSEKVAGLACDVWLIDDGTEKVEACAAKGIPFFDLAKEPKAGKAEPIWAAALTHEKVFPLRLIAHDEAGKEAYRAEATKVDRRKLDESGFQVPVGFKTGDVSVDMRNASLP